MNLTCAVWKLFELLQTEYIFYRENFIEINIMLMLFTTKTIQLKRHLFKNNYNYYKKMA